MQELKGTIRSSFDIRNYSLKVANNLPSTYTCPVKVPVKYQGMKPTCVAHACASVVEYHYKAQYNTYKAFSNEFIYGTREEGYYMGDGMRIQDALTTLLKYGVPSKFDCPGNHTVNQACKVIEKKKSHYRSLAASQRISAYYRCKTTDEIKTAIMLHGPVLVAMKMYNHAKLVNDVYTYDKSDSFGDHCVMIYGWDERGWLTQNSWSSLYGWDGRFVIPFDFKFYEAWGVCDQEFDENLIIKPKNKFTEFLFKSINAIVNWWLNLTDFT